MTTLYGCRHVDVDFVRNATHRYVNSIDLQVTPEQLFEVFEDAGAWPMWAKAITNVEWTNPKPFGMGTTRTVTMLGGLVGVEEFIGWERGVHMAFRFNQASQKTIAAFAEAYDIEATPDGCRLTWTLALEVTGFARVTLGPSTPIMNLSFRMFLRRLQRLTSQRYPK